MAELSDDLMPLEDDDAVAPEPPVVEESNHDIATRAYNEAGGDIASCAGNINQYTGDQLTEILYWITMDHGHHYGNAVERAVKTMQGYGDLPDIQDDSATAPPPDDDGLMEPSF